jgi:hypothetical protein
LANCFRQELERAEKHIILNFRQTSSQTLVDAAYYFCKFQFGSEQFWNKIGQLDFGALSISQLSRLSLALVMNNQPMQLEMTATLFKEILRKMDPKEATGSDAFMLCMAIGRGAGRKFGVDDIPQYSNVIYTLYTVVAHNIDSFNLQQLNKIAMFFSGRQTTEHVPTEFWTESLEKGLGDYLVSLQQYRDDLDAKEFIADISKCLVAMALKGLASPHFLAQVEEVILPDCPSLDQKTQENLLFFLESTAPSRQSPLTKQILAALDSAPSL